MQNLVLGTDVGTGGPVTLGANERRQGMYIIGKTGTGKTTLLESLIVQDMESGLGLCVLDPHGDLVEAVLARVPARREESVILLDLADSQFPLGLNLFECRDLKDRNLLGRVATQAVEVFEKLWGDISWGPQLAQVLRNCAYTLIENQGYSMTEIRRLLKLKEFRAKLTANLANPQVREFWELEYNRLSEREQDKITASTLNKVDAFLTPGIAPIVGFGRSTVDLREVMDKGKILLVKLGLGDVGASAVSLIGSMIVGQLFNAALSRQELSQGDRRQFNLYADEYHRFATPAFAELLAEARKYALATTLAHQFRGQLTDEPNRGATLNAGNLVVFAVHGEDAEELAKQFDRTPPPPEVAGLRPKLTISQDPVSHLLRSGHEDARVRWLAQHRLATWVELAHSEATDKAVSVPIYYGEGDDAIVLPFESHINVSVISAGIGLLNRYFIDLMEGRVTVDSHAEAVLLSDIVECLRGLIGCADGQDVWDRVGLNRDKDPWEKKNFDSIRFHLYLDAYVKDKHGELAAKRRQDLVADRRRKRGDKAGETFGDSDVDHLDFHVLWIRELGRTLSETPILVDSGQWEPYYDKPRSYADVEAEIASNLVGLQKYRARYRLLEGNRTAEGTMRTPEFEHRSRGAEAAAMAIRIRDRTRANYCAPLDEVLEAISKRQQGEAGDSGTHRRVPFTE